MYRWLFVFQAYLFKVRSFLVCYGSDSKSKKENKVQAIKYLGLARTLNSPLSSLLALLSVNPRQQWRR